MLNKVDKFLEMCDLPRLTQEEIENMNRLITNKISTVFSFLPFEF